MHGPQRTSEQPQKKHQNNSAHKSIDPTFVIESSDSQIYYNMILVGKRCAIVCSLLSVWAIVMLAFMGMLLYARSITFAEDLDLHEAVGEYKNFQEFIAEAYKRYASAAHNCWIAACFYIATLAFSLHQYYTNRRAQYGF